MADIAKFLEGTAYGVLNDILAGFRSNEGYAQPNRYEVLVLGPVGVGNGNLENMSRGLERQSNIRNISLRCESINLPGRNLTTSPDSNIYGPVRDIVEGVTYAEDITCVFQSSSGLDERVFFENWQKQAFNEQTWNISYYNDYKGALEIYLLDKNDQRRYGLKIWDAYPKTIGPIPLGYATNNEIVKTEIAFSWRYWTSLDIKQQAPNLTDRITQTVVNTVERNLSQNIPKLLHRL